MNFFWKKQEPKYAIEISVKDSRQSLAPRILAEGDPAFKSVEELRYAMSLPECRNIALTGVFGSGKSSIINTYLTSDDAPKKVLRISLSNLWAKAIENGKEAEFENEVEAQLFQHIIYKANQSKTNRSRFKRLVVPNEDDIKKLTTQIIQFCLCFIIVFEPKPLQIDAFYTLYHSIFGGIASIVNDVCDIFATLFMIWMLMKAISFIIRNYHRIPIKSIKAEPFELGLGDEKSVFKDILDEILYYLKAGEYEAVIFEDLDRIKNPQQLFLKLREINILLNESDYFLSRNRKIKFIYAIKDDIFQNEVRTKSFDYIIPVIPVVDGFNAGEYLIKDYGNVLANIKPVEIKQLGLFITRMRDLTNIMNEFQLYKSTVFRKPMSESKLLAMTIYKNLYPGDYSALHQKEGCLYNVFANKQLFTQHLTSTTEEEITKMDSELANLYKKRIEIRKSLLGVLYTKDNVSSLIIQGKVYSLDQVAEGTGLYRLFAQDKVERAISGGFDDGESFSYDYHFNDLKKKLDDCNYDEEMDKVEADIRNTTIERRNRVDKVNRLKKLSMFAVFRQMGDGSKTLRIVTEICSKQQTKELSEGEELPIARTIHGLIRTGLIDESYSSYISFNYCGSITESEFEFQQSVIQGISHPYDYDLEHVASVLEAFTSDVYSDACILNFKILEHLLKSEHSAEMSSFIETARKTPDFVKEYSQKQNCNQRFFELLFADWEGALTIISHLEDENLRDAMLTLYFQVATQSVMLALEEIQFIGDQYSFLCAHVNEMDNEKLSKYITYYRPVFTRLLPPVDETLWLLDLVKHNELFVVDYENLRVVYGEDFDTKSFTTIQNGSEDLMFYVSHNINHLVATFPETSTMEEETALVSLAKYSNIDDDRLLNYLMQQHTKLSKLSDVSNDRYDMLVANDLVAPSWTNVRQYQSASDDLTTLVPFINRHAEVLKSEKLTDDDEGLQDILLTDNKTLTIEAYRSLMDSCEFIYQSPDKLEGLDEDRMALLIENDFIEYNADFNKFLSEKYSPHLFSKYFIKYHNLIKKYENVQFNNSNLLGIDVLTSTLSTEDKRYFLREFACILDTNDKFEYARLICDFYHTNGVEKADNSNAKLLVSALQNYHEDGSWQTRIELINKIHKAWPSDENRAKLLVDSLGDPYTELNTYATKPTKLHNNEQNRELLDYLKTYCGYISRVIPTDDGQLKVTYRKTK